MEKLFVLFVLALVANGVVSRPQSENNGDLDDRYGPIIILPGPNWQNLPDWLNPQNQPNRPNGPNQPNRPIVPGQQTTTTAPVTPGTDASATRACMLTCPVTSEYNPVCGTDNVLYQNPGRLQCAQACGVAVSLLRAAPCPATTPAPSR